MIEEDPQTIARVRVVETSAKDVGMALTASPDRTLGQDRLGQLLRATDLPAPAAACVSALLIAREHRIPLYSDDRVLRGFARGMGIPAFGTVALVEASTRRGLVETQEGAEIPTAISDLGVWSQALDPGSYVSLVRRNGFDLERCGRPLLADEALLRVDARVIHNALLLSVLASEAADKLQPWATAIVDSYRLLLEVDPVLAASLLVAAQFDPDATAVSDETRERNMKVIAALRQSESVGSPGSDTDPLVGAFRRWLHASAESQRTQLLDRLLAQVDAESGALIRALLDGEPPPS